MPIAIITVGLPKSGKTGAAIELLRNDPSLTFSAYMVIDRGALRKEVAPKHSWMRSDNNVEELTRERFTEVMETAIGDRKNLLIGGTNINTSYRQRLIAKLQKEGYHVVVWLFVRKMHEILQSFHGLGETETELRRIIGRFNDEFLGLVDDRELETEAERMGYDLVSIRQKVSYLQETIHTVM